MNTKEEDEWMRDKLLSAIVLNFKSFENKIKSELINYFFNL